MILLGNEDRRVTVGSLAVHPVLYMGRNGGGAFPVPNEPISGLVVTAGTSKQRPTFHSSNHLYGFVDLKAGATRVQIFDPERRFLPIAVLVNIPDRAPLAAALAAGASVLPVVGDPPVVTVPLRPSVAFRSRGLRATVFGRVITPLGAVCPFAWVRVTTPQGIYITYADERGEYVAPLPFLRPLVSVVDAHAPGDGDDELSLTTTFNTTVRAYRRLTPPPATNLLEGFLTEMDTALPGDPAFDAVYSVGSLFETIVPVTLETHVRVDLLPT